MKKVLYIHVGHFKTGTTALQVFLASNARLLARHGLVYAQTRRNHGKHSSLAFSLFREAGVTTLMHGYRSDTPASEIWTEFLTELRTQKQPGLIVSTEELMRLGAHPSAAAGLKTIMAGVTDIEVRIIAYLRAPDAHLRSWYNQLVKMKQTVPAWPDAVADTIEPVHYDYALALQPWIDIFGADAITVRPYVRDPDDADWLFRDFLDTVGASFTDRATNARPDANPRLDDRLLEPRRILQNADFKPDVVDMWLNRLQGHLAKTSSDADQIGARLDDVRVRSVRGMADLATTLPQAAPALARIADGVPDLRGDAQGGADGWALAGFLMVEMQRIRQAQGQRINQLTQRLEALEAAAGKTS